VIRRRPAALGPASWPPQRGTIRGRRYRRACSFAASGQNLPVAADRRPGRRPEDDRQLHPAHAAGSASASRRTSAGTRTAESLSEAGRAQRQASLLGACTCGPYLKAISAAGYAGKDSGHLPVNCRWSSWILASCQGDPGLRAHGDLESRCQRHPGIAQAWRHRSRRQERRRSGAEKAPVARRCGRTDKQAYRDGRASGEHR
jgi:hypothetical protein